MGQPVTEPQQATVSRKPPFLRTRLLPALLSAGLLYICFFPVNWGWLAWGALVPLLWLTVQPDRRRVKLAAWLGGLVFCVAATQWIRLANDMMYIGWILLAILVSLAFPIFVWLTRLLTLRLSVPLVLAAPIAWVASEFVRANINVGFPWYFLGHAQHNALAVIQIADLFGAYGVSFLVVMVNVAVFELARWVYFRKWPGNASTESSFKFPRFTTLVASLALVVTMGYGLWRLHDYSFVVGPKLALLQGNMPQDIRNNEGDVPRIRDHFAALAAEAQASKPDLIVWSETSWPFVLGQVGPDLSADQVSSDWRENELNGQDMMRVLARDYNGGIPALVGLNAIVLEREGEVHYNSALLVDGAGKFLDRYDKIERVPFGEFIPWEDYVPILKWLSPYEEEADYGIAAGKRLTLFEIAGWRFAVLICYEDSITHLAPRFMRQQPPPDFFLNISNDGWFHGSEQHEQHLVASRFRAIECRRAVARAVNMGVSGIIDGNGRLVLMPGPTWARSKNCTAVLVGNVPIDSRSSLYVWWGDVLPWACWVLALVSVVLATVRRISARRAKVST
jgi:apolipoprotein N-acyltransferase